MQHKTLFYVRYLLASFQFSPFTFQFPTAFSNFAASRLPSYVSIVFVIMTVVVSPRCTVCAVVVIVRVTLHPLKIHASTNISSITTIAVTSKCFLFKFIIYTLTNS